MKFNWGTGIFIFYVIFVGSLAFQVYQSTKYDNSLVVDDYYAKDLDYQTQYDKVKNSLSLSEPLVIDYQANEKTLTIDFPSRMGEATGKILLYRADDKSKDVTITIEKEQRKQLTIPTKDLAAGEWQVSVDWSADGKAYFTEKSVVL